MLQYDSYPIPTRGVLILVDVFLRQFTLHHYLLPDERVEIALLFSRDDLLKATLLKIKFFYICPCATYDPECIRVRSWPWEDTTPVFQAEQQLIIVRLVRSATMGVAPSRSSVSSSIGRILLRVPLSLT